MNRAGNALALVTLVVCGALWLRAMYHQYIYTQRSPSQWAKDGTEQAIL